MQIINSILVEDKDGLVDKINDVVISSRDFFIDEKSGYFADHGEKSTEYKKCAMKSDIAIYLDELQRSTGIHGILGNRFAVVDNKEYCFLFDESCWPIEYSFGGMKRYHIFEFSTFKPSSSKSSPFSTGMSAMWAMLHEKVPFIIIPHGKIDGDLIDHHLNPYEIVKENERVKEATRMLKDLLNAKFA